MTTADETAAAKTLPITFDFKVPLVWLVGGAIAVGSVLIGMYFKLGQLAEYVVELKSEIRVMNETTIKLASEQAKLQWRVEKLEAEGAKR